MQKRSTLLLVALVLFVHCSPATAQEKGRVGLTFAYPTSVGLLWPISPKFALRPEFTASLRSIEASGTSATTDLRAVAVGLSGLFYVREWDALRGYVTPRFAYTRSTTTSDLSQSVVSDYFVAGSFGLQYALGRRFSIFAEVGVGYDWQKGSGGILDTTAHTVAPRSGVGAVFFF